MLATKNNTHVSESIRRLLQQYKGKEGIEGLLTTMVQQIQDLEDAIYPLDRERMLFDGENFPAIGAQLDGLGELVDLPRNGLPDATYLLLILGTIAENFSDSTAPALINVVRTVFNATNVFVKTPNSPGNPARPATVMFGVGDPLVDSNLYPIVIQIVQNALGAAINLVYVSSFDAENAFSMFGPQPWVAGFSSIADPNNGGKFASLIYNNPED